MIADTHVRDVVDVLVAVGVTHHFVETDFILGEEQRQRHILQRDHGRLSSHKEPSHQGLWGFGNLHGRPNRSCSSARISKQNVDVNRQMFSLESLVGWRNGQTCYLLFLPAASIKVINLYNHVILFPGEPLHSDAFIRHPGHRAQDVIAEEKRRTVTPFSHKVCYTPACLM